MYGSSEKKISASAIDVIHLYFCISLARSFACSFASIRPRLCMCESASANAQGTRAAVRAAAHRTRVLVASIGMRQHVNMMGRGLGVVATVAFGGIVTGAVMACWLDRCVRV